MKSFGRLNPEKVFYVIWREKSTAGLFSNVFHVLAHLSYAHEFGLTPVVDMEHFPTLYNEAESIQGSKNSWEYYFNQPVQASLADAYKSKRVVFCYGANNSAFAVYYNFAKAQETARRYLRINSHILAEAERFRSEHFQGKVLGVHMRGQEMKTAAGHPIPPSEEQMLARAEQLLRSLPIDRIFIVSEEQAYVDAFQRRFGEMVLCTDAFRTYEENAYRLPIYPRPLHMYHLGLDVLRDAILLSQCAYLLAGGMGGLAFGSGVSMMAQLLNDRRYAHVELVYNGILPGGPGQRAFIEFIRDYFPGGVYQTA
jgi:hypothetical protein